MTLNEARDEIELPVLEAALEADLPTLGICRGMQALNVVMGGELVQHVENHSGTVDGEHHAYPATTASSSRPAACSRRW